MATATEVRNSALRKLGVIESGGTPSTDEATDVDAAYSQVYAYLATEKAVTWDSDEDVPDEATRFVTSVLCAWIADEFAPALFDAWQFRAFGPDGNSGHLGKLRDLATADRVSVPTRAVYY